MVHTQNTPHTHRTKQPLVPPISDAYTALKLSCWITTLERRLFSAPYAAKDCDAKMRWFLPRFARVLEDPESAWGDWQNEYTAVRVCFCFLRLLSVVCRLVTTTRRGRLRKNALLLQVQTR
jgi:hypothetical protein